MRKGHRALAAQAHPDGTLAPRRAVRHAGCCGVGNEESQRTLRPRRPRCAASALAAPAPPPVQPRRAQRAQHACCAVPRRPLRSRRGRVSLQYNAGELGKVSHAMPHALAECIAAASGVEAMHVGMQPRPPCTSATTSHDHALSMQPGGERPRTLPPYTCACFPDPPYGGAARGVCVDETEGHAAGGGGGSGGWGVFAVQSIHTHVLHLLQRLQPRR